MKIFILFIVMTVFTSPSKAQNENMVWLEKNGTKVGILVARGGRIVYLSKDDSPNLLKADPSQWDENESERPEIGGNSGWKEYNGHIVWVGPQKEWWTQQEINKQRKKSKSVWPPDPWLIYSNFKILEKTDEKLIIRGPESQVSGLSFKKTIVIEEGGEVFFEVEATNMKRDPVSWDLWLNTRISGFAKSYVPVSKIQDIRIDSDMKDDSDTVDWVFCSDYFSYLPARPESPYTLCSSKAYILPSENWMAGFMGNYCLKIEFPDTDPEKIHPSQAIVEIYNRTSVDEAPNLTELEYHSEYKTLHPGQSFKTSERWIVLDYKGKDNSRAHSKFLNKKLREN